MAFGLNLLRAKMFHRRFCNGGPFSKHSFSDDDSLLDLADASYTTLNLVVSALSQKTGLCGR